MASYRSDEELQVLFDKYLQHAIENGEGAPTCKGFDYRVHQAITDVALDKANRTENIKIAKKLFAQQLSGELDDEDEATWDEVIERHNARRERESEG